MPRGKRSKAATAGLKPKRITAKQRAARKINIEKARRAKKRSGGGGAAELRNKIMDLSKKNQAKYFGKGRFQKPNKAVVNAAMKNKNIIPMGGRTYRDRRTGGRLYDFYDPY